MTTARPGSRRNQLRRTGWVLGDRRSVAGYVFSGMLGLTSKGRAAPSVDPDGQAASASEFVKGDMSTRMGGPVAR